MLRFNILPPEEKEIITIMQRTRIAAVWGATFFLLAVFGVFLLLPPYFVLSFQKDEYLRNLSLTKESPLIKRISNVQQSIALLQKSASDLTKISESANSASSLIAETVGRLPKGIILHAASFSFVGGRVSLQGVAETREALIGLETLMKDNARIKNVSVPLSSLVSERNAQFKIDAVLKK